MLESSSEKNDLPSNNIFKCGNIGKNISNIIEDLLTTVHNIIAGIACISNSENLVEIKIQLPEKHPVVVLHYELGSSSISGKCNKENCETITSESSVSNNVNNLKNNSKFTRRKNNQSVNKEHEIIENSNLLVSSNARNQKQDSSVGLKGDHSLEGLHTNEKFLVKDAFKQNFTTYTNMKDFMNISVLSRNEIFKIYNIASECIKNLENEKWYKNGELMVANNNEVNNSCNLVNTSDEYIDIATYEKYVRATLEKNDNKSSQPKDGVEIFEAVQKEIKKKSKEFHDNFQKSINQPLAGVFRQQFDENGFRNNQNSKFRMINTMDLGENAQMREDVEYAFQEKRFHCEICGRSFCHLKEKIQHMKIHSDDKRHICRYCRKTFHRQIDKTQHEMTHTEQKPYTCKYCRKAFVRIGNRNCHERLHAEAEYFPCSFCDKWFLKKSCREIHEKCHSRQELHPSQEDLYPCNYCNKSFITLSKKYRHERIHTRENAHLCSYCGKSFLSPSEKRRHEVIHTGEKPYRCNYCDKDFARKHDKNQHEMTHVVTKTYLCKYCDKPFPCAMKKERHEKFHVGERPYLCLYCEKSFSSFRDKSRHEKIHSTERPFACTYCGKCFLSKSSQRRHEMIHTGDKPHACAYCDKKFFNIGDKKQHEMIHMGIRPFGCDFCEKSFTSMRCKKQHEKLHKMRDATPVKNSFAESGEA